MSDHMLAGIAKLDTGAAASQVLIRNASTRAHVATVVPDVDGSWEVILVAGDYEVTCIGPVGYQPQVYSPVSAVGIPSTGITHRYWRLLITANNGHGSYTTICEIELRDLVGGTDLTTPADAITKSSASDSETISGWADSWKYAFDNTTVVTGANAQWLSNNTLPTVGSPKWIKYDFGAPVTISEVAITGAHSTDANPSTTAIKDFKIQGSDDNVAWVDHATPPSQTGWAPLEVRTFTLA